MATQNNINLTPPIIVAHNGLGVDSPTANAPLYGNGTSAVQALGPLTNGQLIIGSTSAAPVAAALTASTNVTVTNGAGTSTITAGTASFLVPIQTLPANNSATLSFTSGITNTYNSYLITYSGITPVSAAGVQFKMVVSDNGGSTYASTGYASGIYSNAYTANGPANANSSTFFGLTGTSLISQASGFIWCYNLTGGNVPCIFGRNTFIKSSTIAVLCYYGGSCNTNIINALQFSVSSGNISSGTIALYGLLE